MLMLPDFRVRQRDFLLEISRAITAQLDLSEVLRRVLNASVIMLAGQVGLIALRAPDGLFYIRAASAADSGAIPPEIIPKLNQYLHEIAMSGETGMDADLFNEKVRQMMLEIDRKLRQSIALPLIFADEPLGLMFVFRTYRSSATTNDQQILQSFADQAAIAVHNAQLYENIDHERKRLAAILEHSADGVMILDTHLNILRFNRALERMTGWLSAEAIGLHQDDVLVWEHLEQGDLKTAIDEGWPYTNTTDDGYETDENSLYVEGDLLRRDGVKLSVAITYAPMFTTEGKLENIIANVRDITNFRKAQEMQNTFVSVVSHELKTPVAIIKGYTATLRRSDATWEPMIVQEALEVIEDEADRLTALIENLLTASKLQAQREITLDVGEVWLNKLAARSVERFSKQTRKHQLNLNFPEGFPVIHGDQTRLLQVIDNLIGNALKYSPEGGVVEVGGRFDKERVTLYVQDSGIGLQPEERARVFDRFYRVDSKLSSNTQGTGLGLYLSKAIIDAHDGVIDVESTPGKGSTFYFKLHRSG